MEFTKSTHRKNWTFDENEIIQRRSMIQFSEDVPSGWDIEKEHQLRTFYEYKTIEICHASMRDPEKVSATAIIYLKRFYLVHSVTIHHPAVMMLTCIYLAGKVEECRIQADELARHFDAKLVKPEEILKSELILLTALKYSLDCYHPFKPFDGFIADMDRKGLDFFSGQKDDKVEELKQQARSLLTPAGSDLSFMFSPSQIALAVLRLFAPNTDSLNAYISQACRDSPSELPRLETSLRLIEQKLRRKDQRPSHERIAEMEKFFLRR
eukprot:TRINITY_DN9604_c0_g1_i1.p1 TRINITY_DN9604_c0_g1~~TRINITY_DN9604_c0_g1_i1.p1  ORF type:complete len:267 (-),score=40.12 TRINITY_DN9604_c0_g1_i1:223-1023(-)